MSFQPVNAFSNEQLAGFNEQLGMVFWRMPPTFGFGNIPKSTDPRIHLAYAPACVKTTADEKASAGKKSTLTMTAILIDDEPNATEALTNMLRMTTPDVEVIGVANDPQRGIELIQERQPDLLFLDIQMPHITGFELLEKLGKFSFAVIFTTAYDQYALQAFKVSAVDYLLKPIDMDELEAAVAKVRERMQSTQPDFSAFERLFQQVQKPEPQRIALPIGDGLMFVPVADIVRLQSDSNYTMFYLVNRDKVLVSRTLGDYEDMLVKQNFCRVHHSHIINLAQMKRYIKTDGGYAEMSDGSKVEISRRKKDDFVAMLGAGV